MFIHELLTKYGTNALIKAKFVEKWLAKQKWGADPDARRRNFKAYVDLKDNRLVEIIDRIKHSKRGLKALERAGLIDKDNSRRRIRELPDIIMEIEEEVVRESSPGNRVRRPMRETSIEEQRLRRQHREAMVLNDGTRPLGREDIIERDHESPT